MDEVWVATSFVGLYFQQRQHYTSNHLQLKDGLWRKSARTQGGRVSTRLQHSTWERWEFDKVVNLNSMILDKSISLNHMVTHM